jgi:hypothetical protein
VSEIGVMFAPDQRAVAAQEVATAELLPMSCPTVIWLPAEPVATMVMAVGVTLRSIATDTWPPGTGMASWKKLL